MPTTIWTDDFNRADASDIGANWTKVQGDLPIQVKSNTARMTKSATATAATHLATATTAKGDQIVRVTTAGILRQVAGLQLIGVHARATAGAYTYGQVGYTADIVNNSTARVLRWDSDSVTVIASGAATMASSKSLACVCVGSRISVEYDGVEIAFATDTAYASGLPGLRLYNQSTCTNDDYVSADDFVFEIPDTVPIHLLRTHVYPSFL